MPRLNAPVVILVSQWVVLFPPTPPTQGTDDGDLQGLRVLDQAGGEGAGLFGHS